METSEWSGHEPTIYQIRIRETLDQRWVAWFDGMAIRHNADGTTTLEGQVVDQAALYGLISRARDLGLTLLAVLRCEPAADGRSALDNRPYNTGQVGVDQSGASTPTCDS